MNARKRFLKRPEMTPPKRILLCRTDRLGDVILALPCAMLLRRLFPSSWVSFLVDSYAAPVARLLPAIDDVIAIETETDAHELAKILGQRKFDAAVALYPEYGVARALKEANIPLRAGIYYRWFSLLFTYRHHEHRKLNVKHEAEYNLSLTYATFKETGRWEEWLPPEGIFPLPLTLPNEAEDRIAHRLEQIKPYPARLVVLHPGGGGSAHRWPVERFCELARRLKGMARTTMVITGGYEERKFCQSVAAAAGDQGLNLCSELTLEELAALLRRCQLLITNSTGPLHLGRAVGTGVLGLFPSSPKMSPVRWGPYGLPENVFTAPPGCGMEAIEIKTVLGRAQEFLGSS